MENLFASLGILCGCLLFVFYDVVMIRLATNSCLYFYPSFRRTFLVSVTANIIACVSYMYFNYLAAASGFKNVYGLNVFIFVINFFFFPYVFIEIIKHPETGKINYFDAICVNFFRIIISSIIIFAGVFVIGFIVYVLGKGIYP